MLGRCSYCYKYKAVTSLPVNGKVIHICGQCYWSYRATASLGGDKPQMTRAVQTAYNTLVKLVEMLGRFPSAREFCKAMGWKSPRSATWHLRKLECAGMVEWHEGKRRLKKPKEQERTQE